MGSLTIVETLIGLLVIAFLAWAGVVWNMGKQALKELGGIREAFGRLEADIKNIDREFRHHEGKPFHDEAGNRITALEEKMNFVERFHQ